MAQTQSDPAHIHLFKNSDLSSENQPEIFRIAASSLIINSLLNTPPFSLPIFLSPNLREILTSLLSFFFTFFYALTRAFSSLCEKSRWLFFFFFWNPPPHSTTVWLSETVRWEKWRKIWRIWLSIRLRRWRLISITSLMRRNTLILALGSRSLSGV